MFHEKIPGHTFATNPGRTILFDRRIFDFAESNINFILIAAISRGILQTFTFSRYPLANEIEVLIKEFEAEKANLKRMIREAAKSGEYLIAHYHSEALEQVYRKLQTLQNLDDKLYEQKKVLRSLIRRTEETLKRDYPEGFKTYIQHEISKHNEELKRLDLRGKVPAPQSDILDQRLQLLLEKKASYVKIILMKSQGFCLEIKRSRTGLEVSIPKLKSLRMTYLMDDENLQKFITLGFRMTSNESKLILSLFREKDMMTRLKTVILIIVFEIFYFSEFEKESFLEFDE